MAAEMGVSGGIWKRWRVPGTATVLAWIWLFMIGCDRRESSSQSAGAVNAAASLSVVCTTGMVADIVRNVAGDRADVKGLLGEGVDPHLYKPTRTDILTLTEADVVFYNGLLLEGKMTDALVRVASAGKKVWAVTEQLDDSYLLEPDQFQGHHDPHVWMDPTAWSKAVEVVRDAMISVDPDGGSVYESRAHEYLTQLANLGTYAESVLLTVPETQRTLVTAHDAFNYFGRRFGFEVIGIQGISTESEAGVKDVELLVDLVVQRRVPAVFVESTVSERTVLAVIEGAKARGHNVAIGGKLFSDAMGAAGTYEGTYIGMIDHNVTVIARALGGTPPVRGMQGKLAE